MSVGGSRLLRQWLCRPLRNISDINDRLDAVEEISGRGALIGPLRHLLKGMPDLERGLGRARNSTAPPVKGLPDWVVRKLQNRCPVNFQNSNGRCRAVGNICAETISNVDYCQGRFVTWVFINYSSS